MINIKKLLIILYLPLLVWTVVACKVDFPLTPLSKSKAQLVRAQKKWSEQDITSYRIEVVVISSIWHAQTQEVFVQNDVITQSKANCIPSPSEAGNCEIQVYTAEDYTVPGLFARVDSVLKGEYAQWVEITYDITYGFPSIISFDNPNAVDDDWIWRVTSFEALP